MHSVINDACVRALSECCGWCSRRRYWHSPTRCFEGVRCAWRLRQRQYSGKRALCWAEALPKGHHLAEESWVACTTSTTFVIVSYILYLYTELDGGVLKLGNCPDRRDSHSRASAVTAARNPVSAGRCHKYQQIQVSPRSAGARATTQDFPNRCTQRNTTSRAVSGGNAPHQLKIT